MGTRTHMATMGRAAILLPCLLPCLHLSACDGSTDADPCTDPVGGNHASACDPGVSTTELGESGDPMPWFSYYTAPLAHDEAHLYWSGTDGDLLKTPKVGGDTQVLQGPSGCIVTGIAATDTQVYWVRTCGGRGNERAQLWTVAKHGGEATRMLEAPRTSGTMRLHEGRILWTMRQGEDNTHLWSIEVNGAASMLMAANGPYFPFAITPDGVYHRIRHFPSNPSELQRQPVAGGDPETIATVGPVVESMHNGDERLYWVEAERTALGTDRSLWRLGEEDAPELVFQGRVTEFMATYDGAHYGVGFLEDHGTVANRLYRWRAPDFEPVPLVAGLGWPQSLVLDDHHVYWLEKRQGTGSLRLVSASR